MYTSDVTGAHILLTYSDIYADDKPDSSIPFETILKRDMCDIIQNQQR